MIMDSSSLRRLLALVKKEFLQLGRDRSSLLIGTVLLLAYIIILIKRDFPLRGLPVIGKYFK